MTTRKRRPWQSGDTTSVSDLPPAPKGFPQFEHSSFTFEGEIERLGAMGRNRSTAPRWTRIVARILALALLLPFALGLAFFLAAFLRR